MKAKSLFSIKFNRNFGLNSFAFSSLDTSLYKFSIVPYFFNNSVAVLGPTPGTPGISSDESPIKALSSINPLGDNPYSSIILDSS